MLFSEQEQDVGISGLTVQDAWVAMQLLDKAAKAGIINPPEFDVLSLWRSNFIDAIERSVGKNYDEEVAKLIQAQAEAQAEAAQSEPAPRKKPAAKKTTARKTTRKAATSKT